MTSQDTEWRPIPGYEGTYEVSALGNVRSLTRTSRGRTWPTRILRAWLAAGYPQVTLVQNGVRTRRHVHTLVGEAFHGPRPHGAVIRHLDGNRTNNRADNLRWGTVQENMHDAIAHGTNACVRRTHCPQGHPLTGANLDPYSMTTRGNRKCRTCHHARQRARSAGRPMSEFKDFLGAVGDRYTREIA